MEVQNQKTKYIVRMKTCIGLFFILTLLVSSCQDGYFFEKNIDIPNQSWEYKNKPAFEVQITDKNVKFDVYVNLRHNAYYPFSNIYLLLHEKGKGLKDTAYRHEIKLAELDGRWTGRSAGNLYEQSVLIKESYSFPDTGKYKFSIEQNMRENPLHGVNDVGLKLIKK
ncbi:gliding motility lipoprotein GldH [Sphingobacterium sp. DK4209]|uniref:Gliding motility lipoprotein GldH n=2 Tax=Sphingobacterium zhuxiongii TaxID=2662364 RepID=A0A5Q0Q6T3_9SPHI|nr:gliding motility lipoprotein GldH [Sphingobacterium sp. DK4209]QGA24809.1 gliding motility lipoprotein GldH [Sphingobacterium sp. dk4302]